MIIIPSGIKNIIFDLGGVILDINPDATYEAFKKLGYRRPENSKTDSVFLNFLFDFEKGLISEEDFPREMLKFTDLNPTKEELYAAWNIMLLGYKQEKLDFLQKIKTQYRTFLLSNTNIIHARYYNEMLRKVHGIDGLVELFEKVYYSHDLKLRKPDPEIFRLVLDIENLNPSETLFVDDMPENIKSAESFGIIGCHFVSG